jgi:O-antigen/teichoic acid export membrane protein
VAAAVSLAFGVDWLASVWHVGRTTGVGRRMLLANSLRAVVLFSVPCGLAAWVASRPDVPAIAQLALGLGGAALSAVVLFGLVPPVRRDLRTMLTLVRRAGLHRART